MTFFLYVCSPLIGTYQCTNPNAQAIRHKEIRTVYRLTLVKEFNMNEVHNHCLLRPSWTLLFDMRAMFLFSHMHLDFQIAEYAKLVAIGRPSFIEIKVDSFDILNKWINE